MATETAAYSLSGRVTQGVAGCLSPDVPVQLYVQVCNVLDQTTKVDASSSVPPEIQSLIDQFSLLFGAPSSLSSPFCACNHKIPLTLGAQPVFVRRTTVVLG